MPAPANQLKLAKDEFKQYVSKSVEVARTLRDELKIQAHLGTTEARSRWAEIERRLTHVDVLAHELNRAAGELVDHLIDAIRDSAAKNGAKQRAKRRAPKGASRQ